MVLGRIDVAMNYDNYVPETDRAARDAEVAADYERLAEIAEAGAEGMSPGTVREATDGMVAPYRAAAEWSRRPDRTDAELPVTLQKVQAVADSRQAFHDSCENLPGAR